MKSTLAIISIALALTLTLACGQEPVPTPTPTSAPTEAPTPIPPTNTPVAGPVAASNIPMPTRAPIIAPTPVPTSTPRPTRTPISLEFAILDSSREFTSKAGDGYVFHMSGVLSVRTSDGLDIEIPLTYAGDAMPGYNSASLSLATPSQTVEYDVITHQNISEASGETVETRSAFFDTESRRWIETEELLALSALADLRILLGSNLYETSDIAADGQMKLAGQEPLDGVDTHVISGKLSGADMTGTDTDLQVTYRVGVDDALLRRVEISGDLDPSIIGALLDSVSADSVRAELTVNFSDYGKEVAHKSPHLAWPRFNHDATLLDDGRVLVSGGWTGEFDNDDQLIGFPAGISQIYDPLTATWTFKGKLDPDVWEEMPDLFPQTPPARLPDGRLVSVAILGGPHSHPHDIDDYSFGALAVFDTETDGWTRLSDAPVPTNRSFPDAIVLGDGRVLVAGGTEIGSSASDSFRHLAVVEAYDLSTGAWHTLEPMNQPAAQRWLVPLHDGRVLAAGGFTTEADMVGWSSEVEIYDPHTNKWTPAESMTAPHTQAIVLHDGRVLATGDAFLHTDSPVSETYDPSTDEWTATEAMSQRRTSHTLTLLPDGRVLAAGGIGFIDDDYIPLSTTEMFNPVTNAWSSGPELSQPRALHSATLMPDGSILLAGGISERNGERYITLSTEFIQP